MQKDKKIDLRCEDCITGMRKLAAGSIRMIFADPPYNLSGKGHQTVRSGKLVKCDKGEWDNIENFHEFNQQWLAECVRVLADDGTMWISGSLHNHPSVGTVMKELGLWLINDIIWFKRNAAPIRVTNRFVPSTELIWLAAKSKKYYFDYAGAREMNGGKQMRNMWDIPAKRHITTHPTEKPEILLERIVSIGSEPGDLILDPFMGSGTTGVIAKRLGRSFIGFESSDEYYVMANERINNNNA